MNIQTISIVVPCKGCVNNCKFCISNQYEQDYPLTADKFQLKKRIKYAMANFVTTAVITGTGEALQNRSFLETLVEIFEEMDHPFPNVAIQTTGVMLNHVTTEQDPVSGTDLYRVISTYDNIELLKRLGVNTISLSVSDIFSDESNWLMNGTPKKLRTPLETLTKLILDNGFTLRLSLNLTNVYDYHTPQEIVERCKELGAEQITFRQLYAEPNSYTPQAKWVNENSIVALKHVGVDYGRIAIENYIRKNGTKQYKLPFGPYVYSLHGMSTVLDDDCMAAEHAADGTLKYVILRENGKLYTKWDDRGSIVF